MTNLLFEVFARSVFLAGLGLACLWALRKQSASLQHVAAKIIVLALLALPLMTVLLPKTNLYWLPTTSSATLQLPFGKVQVPVTLVQGSTGLSAPETKPLHLWLSFWLIGVTLLAVRYTFGWMSFGRLVRTAKPIYWPQTDIKVLESGETTVPLTGWLGQHFIVVPRSWIGWSEEKKQSALLHEMAHIQNHDWLSQLLAKFACMLFWPNPLAWALAKQSRALAERAADDQVLAQGVLTTTYAQILLEIAREAKATLSVQSEVTISMTRNYDVARRIEMILEANKRRGRATSSNTLLTGMTLLMITALTASLGLARQTLPQGILPDGSPAIQLMIETAIVGPHVLLKETGLRPPKGGRAASSIIPDSKSDPYIYEISKQAAKDLLNKWSTSKTIISSPRIRTLSGQSARIETSSNTQHISLEILPKYNPDKTIEVKLSYHSEIAGTQSFRSVEFRTKPGQTILITGIEHDGKPIEVFALITANVVKAS